MRAIALLLLLCACGSAPPPQPKPVVALEPPSSAARDPEPAPPPASPARWQGVYYDPLFGYLHLVMNGVAVEGRWLRPTKGRWGKLVGTAEGNRLRFRWEEHLSGEVGPGATGRGHFVYKSAPDDSSDDTIEGELEGIPWRAVKQRNMAPDINQSPEAPNGDWGE